MQGMCRLSMAMWLVGVLASAFDAFDNRAHFVGKFPFSSNALARFGWFNVPPISGSSGKVSCSLNWQHPGTKGVSVGAMLSDYERARVEHI